MVLVWRIMDDSPNSPNFSPTKHSRSTVFANYGMHILSSNREVCSYCKALYYLLVSCAQTKLSYLLRLDLFSSCSWIFKQWPINSLIGVVELAHSANIRFNVSCCTNKSADCACEHLFLPIILIDIFLIKFDVIRKTWFYILEKLYIVAFMSIINLMFDIFH